MSEKPILFSAPMVRALLAGTKSQTRRALKPQPNMLNGGKPMNNGRGSYSTEGGWKRFPVAVGDLLWVKEGWAPLSALTHSDPGTQALADGGFYRADGGTVEGEISKWTSPIFMPRRASRITLKVTNVRVQRLQEISPEDARDEGVERRSRKVRQMWLFGATNEERAAMYLRACVWEYEDLWNAINGPESWNENPWVAAYTFDVHRCNISKMTEAAGVEVREIA